jgi:hypothetical protein
MTIIPESKPSHMSGPEWKGWEVLFEPAFIKWVKVESWEDVIINNKRVASLERRPYYCDRGHWVVKCELPDIDGQDGFPRYYMKKETAIEETEAFLKWRLWKQQ